MKVAITGHTRGIGKSLSKIFPDFLGFSRSNGYDINDPVARQRILAESIDCDVFVNNAHCDFGQQYLLYDFWEAWQSKNKIIVNIGSRAADYVYHREYPHYKYSIQKLALEGASKYMTHCLRPCKVICVKPGYVDTEGVRDKPGNKMDPDDLATFIKELVENDKSFWIPVVTLYPR
jgi:NAD(P)-dependent dehydrogenase (short-subunit alcohol dehydrogenase family)